MTVVTLRPVRDGDAESMFRLESDEVGADMIAMLPRAPGDRIAFDQHWNRTRKDITVINRIIDCDGAFAGYAVSFLVDGQRQVGYWVERSMWGQGIASSALRLLLEELDDRPLWARVASDNVGSRRVLERAGFEVVGVERVLAPRRSGEVSGLVFRLG
ncbi:MAG: GNAT family N-acetyltransferase [Acidobacteria bacterium]|nr:GNAT family N-acetyltransferase [Acidobacteriota bacterium]